MIQTKIILAISSQKKISKWANTCHFFVLFSSFSHYNSELKLKNRSVDVLLGIQTRSRRINWAMVAAIEMKNFVFANCDYFRTPSRLRHRRRRWPPSRWRRFNEATQFYTAEDDLQKKNCRTLFRLSIWLHICLSVCLSIYRT